MTGSAGFESSQHHLASDIEDDRADVEVLRPARVDNIARKVEDGVLKIGTPLCIPENGHLDVGIVTGIQVNQRDQERAKKGTECAVKITNASNPTLTYGRQFDHEKKLYSKLSRESIDALKKYFKDDMTDSDWRLVIKLKKVFSVI